MQKKKTKKILIGLIAFSCLILFSFFASNKVKNFYHLILSPAENYFWQKNNSSFGFLNCLFNYKNTQEENQSLKKENISLSTAVNNLQEMAKENEALRKLNELENKKGFNLLLAQIASRGVEQDTILINKGKIDGIKEGMAALNQAGVLLGSLSEVFDNFSRVALITSPNQTFDISIKSTKDVLALAKGSGNLNLIFQFALKEEALSLNDLVFTSDLGGKFPKGILVGFLEEIQKNEAEKFQEGVIKPYFLETNMNQIFIILSF